MRLLALAVLALLAAGCGPRLPREGSLTIKLHEDFSAHYGRPAPLPYTPELNWEYEPDQQHRRERDARTHGAKEHLKNAADDIGEEIAGQIVVSLVEIMVKGTAAAVAAGVQGLSEDEVNVAIIGAQGRIDKLAEEGFNRWLLSASDRVALAPPWRLELWSTLHHAYLVHCLPVDEDVLATDGRIELELRGDGTVRVNGRLVLLPAYPASAESR